MEINIAPEMSEVVEAEHLRPSVSIIMACKPKAAPDQELTYALKITADKIEKQLLEKYAEAVTASVMQKLNDILAEHNFDTDKKSIFIYVSPVFEKVMYLNAEVEERIIINEPFEIRDLVFSKKQLHKYLLLLLNGNESRLYLCNTNTYLKLMLDIPEIVYSYVNEVPERAADSADMSDQKQAVVTKFLRHIDNGLEEVLKSYKLPLFVLGPEKIVGQFQLQSRHKNSVSHYIPGNYTQASIEELTNGLAPCLAARQKEREQQLMVQLEEAEKQKCLAVGIKSVWREAMQHNGRLLVVEENYMYATQHGSNKNIMNNATELPYNERIYIKDAVDEILEEVLKNGGEVEFVKEGILDNYHHIALILYY